MNLGMLIYNLCVISGVVAMNLSTWIAQLEKDGWVGFVFNASSAP